MALDGLAEHLMAIVNGERPIPVTTAKRHHYVPQFLLRRFTNPAAAGEPKLNMLDKTTGRVEEVTTRGTAWERNLYAIHDEGKRDMRFEGLLSVIEDYAAQALVSFMADPLAEDFGTRFVLAMYLALQEGRTPAALAERREMLRQMGTMLSVMAVANATGKPRSRMREAQNALLEGRVNVEPTDGMALGMMLQPTAELAEAICGLPWVLFRAKEGEFVLSDRPITRHDPTPPHGFSAGAWMSSPFVYTTLPIDPMHCLRISPTGRNAVTIRETSRQMHSTNLRTYGWGTRYVMGRSADVLNELHERALADPTCVPDAKTQRIVLLEDPATADPMEADANRAKGWEPHLFQRTEEGDRALSYRVLDTVADARAAMAPRPIKQKSE